MASWNIDEDLKADGSIPLTAEWDVGGFALTNVSKLLVGTTLDLGGKLQVLDSGLICVELRDTDTDASRKRGCLAVTHYTNVEEPVGIFIESDVATSTLNLGGGTTALNAPTAVKTWAAATTTAVSGTEIARVTVGGTRIEVGVAANARSPLDVVGQMATGLPVLTLEQLDGESEMIEFAALVEEDGAIEAVGVKSMTTTHFIRVLLPGALVRYLRVGTIAEA